MSDQEDLNSSLEELDNEDNQANNEVKTDNEISSDSDGKN